MNTEPEDIVFLVASIIVIILAFYFGIIYDSMVATFLIGLIVMLIFIVGHSYIYIRKKKDLNILKIRLLAVSPIFIILFYFLYLKSIDHDFSKYELFTINGLALFFLGLSVIGQFVYRRKIHKNET
jgi:hypothetical protein